MDKKRRWFGRRVGKKLSLRRKALIMTLLPKIKINKDTKKQINPAIDTVVNFGVSGLHLKLTEKTENPIADTNPKTKPTNVFFS